MISKTLFAALFLLALNSVDGYCRAGYCESSVNGDFVQQDATPDEWAVFAKDPETDVELHHVYPSSEANYTGKGELGMFLKVKGYPDYATTVTHNNIVLPPYPPNPSNPPLFTFKYIVPFSKTNGSILLLDNNGKIYFEQKLAEVPVGKWVTKSVLFNIRSPSAAIRWRVVVSSTDLKPKVVMFNFIDICAPINKLPYDETLGANLLPDVWPARTSYAIPPWSSTGTPKVSIPSGGSNVIEFVEGGNAPCSIAINLSLNGNSCYHTGGLVLGAHTYASLPIEVILGNVILAESQLVGDLEHETVDGKERTRFTFKFCPKSTSTQLRYRLKANVKGGILLQKTLNQVTCRIRQISRRSGNLVPDEL